MIADTSAAVSWFEGELAAGVEVGGVVPPPQLISSEANTTASAHFNGIGPEVREYRSRFFAASTF